MERTKRFTVGQQLTYKDAEEYFHGGENYGGQSAILLEYKDWYPGEGCYTILVTTPDEYEDDYQMLENEFVEYEKKEDVKVDIPQVPGLAFKF